NGLAAVAPDGHVAVYSDWHHRVHLYDRQGKATVRCGGTGLQPSPGTRARDKEHPRARPVPRRSTRPAKGDDHGKPLPQKVPGHASGLDAVQPMAPSTLKDPHFERTHWSAPPLGLGANGITALRLYRDKKETNVVMQPRAGKLVLDAVSFVGPDRVVFATT